VNAGPRPQNVAIVGATGLVGETLLRILDERRFPIAALRCYATARSSGAAVRACGVDATVERLEDVGDPFAGIDVAFFAGGDAVSRRYALGAAAAGALVVDKSTVYRLDPSVPLVVPEVNASSIGAHQLIANPNCSTIPLAVALAPIERAFGLSWVSVSTYQSVSGAGKDAVEELAAQSAGSGARAALPRRIAGNVVPEIGPFGDDGYVEEEQKIAAELQKILSLPDLRVSATTVRVPVVVGHSETVSFAPKKPAPIEEIRGLLKGASGVRFLEGNAYTTPLEAAGSDEVFVGRLRADHAHPGAYLCWVVCDNLRKGAATNAVQIVEAALRARARVPA
jgi:aspartate-semialdehyde dehydrogenase